jgi:peptidoglycan/xylan/chitin deacetylase (PgdA/CDA1 family)
MYHYVRDPERTAYPRMNVRRVRDFVGQLDYIADRFNVVTLEDVVAAFTRARRLPARACLLTFDDGLRDHVDTVLPLLVERDLTAVFAGSGMSIVERRVTDVQKIQLTLAAVDDHEPLLAEILSVSGVNLPPDDGRRFDSPATANVKILLQYALPEGIRRELVDELFARHVHRSESLVADELYMTLGDLSALRDAGMGLAGHGWTHEPLVQLTAEARRDEITRTRELLESVGCGGSWAFVYPSGFWNDETLAALSKAHAAVAFTTEVQVATLAMNPLTLPRLDTNDLPTARETP